MGPLKYEGPGGLAKNRRGLLGPLKEEGPDGTLKIGGA